MKNAKKSKSWCSQSKKSRTDVFKKGVSSQRLQNRSCVFIFAKESPIFLGFNKMTIFDRNEREIQKNFSWKGSTTTTALLLTMLRDIILQQIHFCLVFFRYLTLRSSLLRSVSPTFDSLPEFIVHFNGKENVILLQFFIFVTLFNKHITLQATS